MSVILTDLAAQHKTGQITCYKPGQIICSQHECRPPLAIVLPFGCNTAMSEAPKYDIRVDARTTYLADQSDEAAGRYAFAYTITIVNAGTVAAQLISRHWIITDANEQMQEVRGPGVVGEQPLLKPHESFEYTSGTTLATGVGTMRGSYQMIAEDGHQFDALIPQFTLSIPRVLH